MHLGLIPTLNPHSGGLYQYARTVMDAVSHRWDGDDGRSVAVLGDPTELKHAGARIPSEWQRIALSPRWDPRRLRYALARLGIAEPIGWVVRHLSRGHVLWQSGIGRNAVGWDRRNGLDLTLWTTARREIARFEGPMAVAFHDIQHRLHRRFPEFSAGGRGSALENQLRIAASQTSVAIVESATGRDDLLDAYGDFLDEHRVRILPYPPPPHISADDRAGQIAKVRGSNALPERYFFYPAQFWKHKNHEGIIGALRLLRDRSRLRPPLVLSGSRRGTLRRRAYKELMGLAAELGISDQIVVLDYVPEEQMGGLYLGAAGLVMPTFCGPSNLPILEAWVTGCPVITSDIRGVREQAGDAALLVDPSSVEEIADAIELLWSDGHTAATLAARGRERLKEFTPESFADGLRAALDDAAAYGSRTT